MITFHTKHTFSPCLPHHLGLSNLTIAPSQFPSPCPFPDRGRTRFFGESAPSRPFDDVHFFARDGDISELLSWLVRFSLRGEDADSDVRFGVLRNRMVL